MANVSKIHRVIEGPYEDGELCWLLCLAEDSDGDLLDVEIYTETLADAFIIRDHFNKTIEPLVLRKQESGVTKQ